MYYFLLYINLCVIAQMLSLMMIMMMYTKERERERERENNLHVVNYYK